MAAATTTRTVPAGPDVDTLADRRTALQSRHAQALAALMAQREDLRGVHALADLVDDALRWTA